MRALVVGGSGQIGGWLLRTLAERGHEAEGTYHSVAYPGLTHLDAADTRAASAWVRERAPDVVFYPAGLTWVDGCERNPAAAEAANRDQPLTLARAAAGVGARFVYFSTDYVFDGKAGPYTEDDPVAPLNAYGRSKLETERELAAELGDRQLTARTSWVFGPERQGKNFAYQLVKSLKAGRPMACPSDQRSSPTYGPDVAKAAVLLMERGASGLIHMAGPEVMDRVCFARRLAEGFGLDMGLITSATTEALGQGAPRPLQGGLITSKAGVLAEEVMRPIALAVKDFREHLAAREGWADPLAG